MFVTKLNAAGSARLFHLSGRHRDEKGDLTIDSAGNTYISGLTRSGDFPTLCAFQPTFAGGTEDAFITKLNSTGAALVYSSFLGGSNNQGGDSEQIIGIAVDPRDGSAYVVGNTSSTDFPTQNAVQPSPAAAT